MKKSKIGSGEWLLLFFIVGVIDFVQWFIIEGVLIWFLGIGAEINEVIDPMVGVALGGYLQMRGVNVMFNYKRLLWLVGTEAAAAVTGGFYQLWILALGAIYLDVKAEEKSNAVVEPLNGEVNQNGVRQPNNPQKPLNQGGVRLPPKV